MLNKAKSDLDHAIATTTKALENNAQLSMYEYERIYLDNLNAIKNALKAIGNSTYHNTNTLTQHLALMKEIQKALP